MSGISHLLNGHVDPNRSERVTSMSADQMNAFVSKRTGLNQWSGGDAPAPATNAPMPQGAPSGQMAVMQERIDYLEKKISNIENIDPASVGPSNRGPESSAWARDMPDKRAGKRLRKKMPVDPSDQEEDLMTSVIGMTMEEFNSLAGMEANQTSHSLHESRAPEFDDIYEEDEVEEITIAEAWSDFLESRGLTIEEFGALADQAMEDDNIEDMDALLSVEDMFNSMIGSMDESEEDEVTYDSRDEAIQRWSYFLADNDLTVEQFDNLVRQAQATEDDEMLDELGRVVQIFEAEAEPKKKMPAPPKEGAKPSTSSLPLRKRGMKTSPGGTIDFGKFGGKQKFQRIEDDEHSFDEEGNMEFECDSDDAGEPSVPWAKIVKAYKIKGKKSGKSKSERGFGGMSRVGV